MSISHCLHTSAEKLLQTNFNIMSKLPHYRILHFISPNKDLQKILLNKILFFFSSPFMLYGSEISLGCLFLSSWLTTVYTVCSG